MIFVDEDATGSDGLWFVECELSGEGQLEVGVGATAYGDVGNGQDGGREYLDVVGTCQIVRGSAKGLVGEYVGLAMTAHQDRVGGELEGDALVLEMEA